MQLIQFKTKLKLVIIAIKETRPTTLQGTYKGSNTSR